MKKDTRASIRKKIEKKQDLINDLWNDASELEAMAQEEEFKLKRLKVRLKKMK